MVHLLSLPRNWQGVAVFIQSPVSSLYSQRSLNWRGFMPKWVEIRIISALVYVGVMVLQQLAHARQSISSHTSRSTSATSSGISSGTILSSLARNLMSLPFFLSAFLANFFKSITNINIVVYQYAIVFLPTFLFQHGLKITYHGTRKRQGS